MLSAEITVGDESGHLYELFRHEQKEMLGGRVKYTAGKSRGLLTISFHAKDSVALRSALNTVTKIITVYEKTRGAIKNG